jgi:LPS export ABC transporter protein LptC
VELRQLSLTVYTDEGLERAFVTAAMGWLNLDTNEMVARGNAVLTVRTDNRIIESAELHYDPNEDRIWSDSATVQRFDGVVSEGSSFESNLDFTNVLIRNMRTRGGAVRY